MSSLSEVPDFRLSVERDEICKECGGIGGAAGAVKRCDNCQGSGIQVDSCDFFKR